MFPRGWSACRRLLPAVPTALFAVLALATFLDYGLTWDEQNLVSYGQDLTRWYTTLGRDRDALREGDHYLYGGLFELLAQAAGRVSPLGLYETRHLLNAGFGAVALAATAGLGCAFGGRLGGFVSSLLLLTHPVFYGHSFNNPKDVPFAALYALALLAGVSAVRRRRFSGIGGAALTGLAVGATLGMRVAGVILLPGIGLLWLFAALRRGEDRRSALAHVFGRACVMTGIAWIVMLALWPYAQVDPWRHPLAALRVFQDFHADYLNLFEGRLLRADELPRRYLPLWIAITSPEPHLALPPLAVLLAAAVAARTASRRLRERAAGTLWLALVTALPVLWVVLRRPPLYDGMRHFLFLLPGLAVLGGVGARLAWDRIRWQPARAVAVALGAVATAAVAREMAELHPYQAVYFNRLSGGLGAAHDRFETDYWGSSYKEGVEWLATHYAGPYGRPLGVANTSKCILTSYYLEKGDRPSRFVPVCGDAGEPPNVVLTTTRQGRHQTIPGALMHLVSRQGVPLCYVFQVRRPWLAGAEEPPPRKWQPR